jgi:hypothetical protein
MPGSRGMALLDFAAQLRISTKMTNNYKDIRLVSGTIPLKSDLYISPMIPNDF